MSAVPASPAALGSAPLDPVRALQHALYRAAKADPGRRFHALWDKVLRRDVLWRAWVAVRQNNGAPGIDATTLADVEEYGVSRFLDELATEVRDGSYRPLPARRVFIPKPGSREKRPLSIPPVRDRVVQAALKIVLEPVFEADFLPCSFGFRPRRGTHDALQVVIDESWRGRCWVVETDIANCLDAWSHCSFADCGGLEQPVLGGWHLDTQAFPASGAGQDGAQLAALEYARHGRSLGGESPCATNEGGCREVVRQLSSVLHERWRICGPPEPPCGGRLQTACMLR